MSELSLILMKMCLMILRQNVLFETIVHLCILSSNLCYLYFVTVMPCVVLLRTTHHLRLHQCHLRRRVQVASFLSHHFAQLLNTLLRFDIEQVATGERENSIVLVYTLLSFTSYPFTHRSTTLSSIDFWTDVEDVSVERHQQLDRPVVSAD
jgi:hypothetical protein